ncbi:MAG: TIM barrel protein [Bacteroidota bacterium]
MQPNQTNRRRFLRTTSTLALGTAIAPSVFSAPGILKHYKEGSSKINGVQIGVITYSFRSMKDQSAEATLQYIKDCGISAIELMGGPAETFVGMPKPTFDRRAAWMAALTKRGGKKPTKEQEEVLAAQEAYNREVAQWRATVSMDKFKTLRKMYKAAGVDIYAFKPRAFGKDNTDAEINYGLAAAKALGASHITLEHPSDDAHTMKLGKMAKKHKIFVGYHGHTQQTPDFWDTALDQAKYNAMNIDIGHYVAAGHKGDALGIIERKNKHIKSMHLKDRMTKENGQSNEPWGTGDTPIPSILQLMRDNKYKFPATIELEYNVPEDSDAVQEVKKCLEYCREALS